MLEEAPLATPAGVDLRLHHHDGDATRFDERAHRPHGFVGIGGDPPDGNADAALAQQVLGLVLVDLQETTSKTYDRPTVTETSR